MIDALEFGALPLARALSAFFTNPLVLICLLVDALVILRLAQYGLNGGRLVARMRSRPWPLREAARLVLALTAAVLAVRLSVSFLFHLETGGTARREALWVIGQTLFLHACVVMLIAGRLRPRRLTWREAFGLERRRAWPDARRGAVGYLAAVPAVGALALTWSLFLVRVGLPPEPQLVVRMLMEPQPAGVRFGMIAIAVVTAPVAEELLFRGVGLPLFIRRFGVLPGITLLSLLFAAVHFHLFSWVPLFAMAWAFSLAYLYSGSIVAPIVMHALFNGVSLAILFAVHAPGAGAAL